MAGSHFLHWDVCSSSTSPMDWGGSANAVPPPNVPLGLDTEAKLWVSLLFPFPLCDRTASVCELRVGLGAYGLTPQRPISGSKARSTMALVFPVLSMEYTMHLSS